jgi:hypothetical protein
VRALLKAGKRWLVLGHRWLGIGTALFFLAWLLSGLVMMYVPFPGLTEAERLAALPPIALAQVAVPPGADLVAGARIELEMQGDEPVYRLVSPRAGTAPSRPGPAPRCRR